MRPLLKRSLLGLALVVTLVAVWKAPPSADESISTPVSRSRVEGGRPPSARDRVARQATSPVLEIRRRGEEDDIDPAFPSKHWDAPKAKTVKVAEAPPTPQAPPLPFKVLGRYVEDGKLSLFLQQGERNLVVHEGDVIDKTYRIASTAGGAVTFIYLPLDQKQTLAVGDSN